MNNLILDSEATIRFSIFISVFFLLAIVELIWPRRELSLSRSKRWSTNLTLSFANTLLVRLFIPIAGISSALLMEKSGLGLFNVITLPLWLEIALFVLLFDLTIYWQHRLYHLLPILWRLHRVHHTDTDYDLTTGNRFHPVSILLSALVKLLLVFLLGPVAIAVLAVEILLNLSSMFNHSNLRLPLIVDRALRYLIVTPDMHRIHHSQLESEHNRNFGFNLSCWDRLFGSYLDQPVSSHESMQLGIEGYTAEESAHLPSLLMQPLQSK